MKTTHRLIYRKNYVLIFALSIVLMSVFVLVNPQNANADTIVNRDIEKDTVWTMAGSPYLLESPVTVRSGFRLTISPGVTVSLKGGSLLVADNATLIAEGTSSQVIRFVNESEGFIPEIHFYPKSHIVLRNCELNYGGFLFLFFVSDAIIDSCLIQNLSGVSVSVMGDTVPTIVNSSFVNNKIRPISLSGSNIPSMKNLTFLNNGFDGITFSDVTLEGNSTYTLPVYLYEGNISVSKGATLVIEPGTKFIDGGVRTVADGRIIANGTYAKPIVFTRNHLRNVGEIIQLGSNIGPAQRVGSQLSNCIIEYGKTGILAEGPFTIDSCVFRYNEIGLQVNTRSDISPYTATIQYSQIYSNTSAGIIKVGNSNPITVDAKLNYWGHPTGPKNIINPPGKGDLVSDKVNFVPFLRWPQLSPAKHNQIVGQIDETIIRTITPDAIDDILVDIPNQSSLVLEVKVTGDLPLIVTGSVEDENIQVAKLNDDTYRILYTNPTPGLYTFGIIPDGLSGTSQYTFRIYKTTNHLFSITPNILPSTQLQLQATGIFRFAFQVVNLCTGSNPAIATGTLVPVEGDRGVLDIDFTNVAPGNYALCIDWPDGKQVLANAVTIASGLSGNLVARIEPPPNIRVGRNGTAFLYYANTGTAPIRVPAFVIVGSDAEVRLNERYEYAGSLSLMGYSSSAPVNWLMPNEERRITFEIKPTKVGAKVLLETYTDISTDAFPWDTLRIQMQPTLPSEEWIKDWNSTVTHLGTTWGSVAQSLGQLVNVHARPPNRMLFEEIIFWLYNGTTSISATQSSELSDTVALSIDEVNRKFSCSPSPSEMPYYKSYSSESDISFWGPKDAQKFDPTSFDSSMPTFIITHGNNDSQNNTSVDSIRYTKISDEITEKIKKRYNKTPNIIRVDWNKPAAGLYAPDKAICIDSEGKNILQRVGEDVANKLLIQLQSVGKTLNLTQTVFVGHSFGNAVGYEAVANIRARLGPNALKPTAIVLDPANAELSDIHISDYSKNFNIKTSVAFYTNSIFDEEDDIGLDSYNISCEDTPSNFHPIDAHGYGIDIWTPRAIQNCWNPLEPSDRANQFVLNCGKAITQPVLPSPGNGVPYTMTVVASLDPNDKLTWSNFVQPGDAVRFTIRFENFITATAPAQDVLVADQLSPLFDWSTVRFQQVGFGSKVIPIYQDALQTASTKVNMIDYRPEVTQTLDISITASADIRSGQLLWSIVSIDPRTGKPPTDPLAGFLPPNDTTGRGDGFVTFEVKVKDDTPLGNNIANVATIIFDMNDPINTPPVSTIVGAPTSQVFLPFVQR